jgi:hypothetical protein
MAATTIATTPPPTAIASEDLPLPDPSPAETTATAAAPSDPPRAAAPPASTPAPKAADSIAAQVAALDAAQRLLASGDANGCLRALDRLTRDYPRTPLAQEATVLRVEALAASGRKAEARALASRFLAEHPDSPYATRLGTVVDR